MSTGLFDKIGHAFYCKVVDQASQESQSIEQRTFRLASLEIIQSSWSSTFIWLIMQMKDDSIIFWKFQRSYMFQARGPKYSPVQGACSLIKLALIWNLLFADAWFLFCWAIWGKKIQDLCVLTGGDPSHWVTSVPMACVIISLLLSRTFEFVAYLEHMSFLGLGRRCSPCSIAATRAWSLSWRCGFIVEDLHTANMGSRATLHTSRSWVMGVTNALPRTRPRDSMFW